MTGLINLVSQYSDRLTIIPIICLIFAIISVITYKLNSRKIVKYIPSLLTLVIAIIITIIALSIFTTKSGLNMAFIAIFLGAGSLVGILTCFIIDLFNSINKDYKYINGNEMNEGKRVARKVNRKKKGA